MQHEIEDSGNCGKGAERSARVSPIRHVRADGSSRRPYRAPERDAPKEANRRGAWYAESRLCRALC
jgi:hypothetical protein